MRALTERQRLFAEVYARPGVDGGNVVSAYLSAGYARVDPEHPIASYSARAYAVLKNPRVKALIAKIRRKREEREDAQRVWDVAGVVREHVRMYHLARRRRDLGAATANLMAIGKTCGAYQEGLTLVLPAIQRLSEAERVEMLRISRLRLLEDAGNVGEPDTGAPSNDMCDIEGTTTGTAGTAGASDTLSRAGDSACRPCAEDTADDAPDSADSQDVQGLSLPLQHKDSAPSCQEENPEILEAHAEALRADYNRTKAAQARDRRRRHALALRDVALGRNRRVPVPVPAEEIRADPPSPPDPPGDASRGIDSGADVVPDDMDGRQ